MGKHSFPTFSPIFLEPLILRARRARKIKGSRKIGEGIVKRGIGSGDPSDRPPVAPGFAE